MEVVLSCAEAQTRATHSSILYQQKLPGWLQEQTHVKCTAVVKSGCTKACVPPTRSVFPLRRYSWQLSSDHPSVGYVQEHPQTVILTFLKMGNFCPFWKGWTPKSPNKTHLHLVWIVSIHCPHQFPTVPISSPSLSSETGSEPAPVFPGSSKKKKMVSWGSSQPKPLCNLLRVVHDFTC